MNILIVLLVFIGCMPYKTIVVGDPHKFEAIGATDFDWRSTSSSKLEFVVPDNDMRNSILVEVFNVNTELDITKSVSSFLTPSAKFSKDLKLANDVVAIKVKVSQE